MPVSHCLDGPSCCSRFRNQISASSGMQNDGAKACHGKGRIRSAPLLNQCSARTKSSIDQELFLDPFIAWTSPPSSSEFRAGDKASTAPGRDAKETSKAGFCGRFESPASADQHVDSPQRVLLVPASRSARIPAIELMYLILLPPARNHRFGAIT
jgi:hypothetical protein